MSDLLHARIFNTPHLISPEKLQAICFAVRGRMNLTVEEPGQEVMRPAASVGRWENRDRQSGMVVEGGVGIIPITGTLVNRGTWIGTSSGLQSYDGIAQQLRMAADNPKIHSVLLDLNSYGGEASGVADLAEEIRELASIKRVVALASDAALSAGYWIAAAATEVVTTQTGMLGSIGVVLTHQDVSAAAERAGIRITHIYAGAEKIIGSPYLPLSESDTAKLQADVDQLYDLFSARIGAYRSGKVDAKATEARVYRGQDAVTAGLADRVMTGRALLAEMQKANGRRRSAMSDERTYTEAEAQARINTALESERAKHDAALATARTEAATAERARVAKIHSLAQVGFEKERDAAIESGASAADFALNMLSSAADRGVTLGQFIAESPKVVKHASAPNENTAQAGKPWDQVITTQPNKM